MEYPKRVILQPNDAGKNAQEYGGAMELIAV